MDDICFKIHKKQNIHQTGIKTSFLMHKKRSVCGSVIIICSKTKINKGMRKKVVLSNVDQTFVTHE